MKSIFKITPLFLALAACGGGGGTPAAVTPAPLTPVAPEVSGVSGFYDGMLSFSDAAAEMDLTGAISATGRAAFVAAGSDDVAKFFYLGKVSASGSVVTANLTSYVPDSVNGSVINARQVYSPDLSGTRTAATGDITVSTATTTPGVMATMTLHHQPVDSGADLAKLAGTYSDFVRDTTVTIAADGRLTGSTFSTDCSYTGTVSVPDASRDIYAVDDLASTCPGQSDAKLAISGASGLLTLGANDVDGELLLVAGNATRAIALHDLTRTEEQD